MNFFDHKDLGNHLLQLCPKVVKHPVYTYIYVIIYFIPCFVGFYLRMNIFVMDIKEINPPKNKACAECFNEEIKKKKKNK